MKLNNLLEIIASENKLKIIAHYWDCSCKDKICVTDLQNLLGLNQSNLSKHLSKLKQEKILDVIVKQKERVYLLNLDFKKKWSDILNPIINFPEIKKFMCNHCKTH